MVNWCAADSFEPRPGQSRSPTHFIRNVGLECLIKVSASHALLGRCLTRLVPILSSPRIEYGVYWLAIVVSC